MTAPRLDPAIAWDLFVALDMLAASHTLGELVSPRGGPLGALAHAHDQVVRHQSALETADPQLLDCIETVLSEWASRPADRLMLLLPLRDELSERSGGRLPDTLPPAP